MTECELLSIVETLKEFRNILIGQRIQVYTDHKNLTYKQFNTECVIRWSLIIEEYAPELIYIHGEHNIVADALSRLDIAHTSSHKEQWHDMHYLLEHFGLDKDDLPNDSIPMHYKLLAKEQFKDKTLLKKVQSSDAYHLKTFHGVGKE